MHVNGNSRCPSVEVARRCRPDRLQASIPFQHHSKGYTFNPLPSLTLARYHAAESRPNAQAIAIIYVDMCIALDSSTIAPSTGDLSHYPSTARSSHHTIDVDTSVDKPTSHTAALAKDAHSDVSDTIHRHI